MAPAVTALEDPRATADADFPADGPPEAQLRFLLRYAVLAPSVLNTQPWRFEIEENLLRLYGDRSRQLRALDPAGRALTISCGAALLNLRVAAHHFGLRSEVYPFPFPAQPCLFASVVIADARLPSGIEGPEEDEALHHAIARRSTGRHPFLPTPIPAEVEEALGRAAREEGATLTFLKSEQDKGAAARLIEAAIRRQGQNRALVEEIAAWLRPTADRPEREEPDATDDLWNRYAALQMSPATLAAGVQTLLVDAPALLVLSTEADGRSAWLAAGQALERVLLVAASRGLWAAYVNQPVEVAETRAELARIAGTSFPQLVFRLGYARTQERAPRRPLREMVETRHPDFSHRLPSCR